MASFKSIYEPREDSILLERYVRQYAKGHVLDIGTGSGIQAIAAAANINVKSVLATDVQRTVIEYCKKHVRHTKIKFLQSDLFGNIKGKFDTIIFNPPYLPFELKLKDLTIEGGKKGYEVIEKFISEVNKFLSRNGIILMVFSSLTKKEKVEEFIKNNLLDFKELERLHIFFEDIHAYLLRKNDFLKKLENEDIQEVKYLTKGHRGLLFTGIWNNKKSIIKIKNPKSKAIGRIENESKWLKELNKHGIGPKLFYHEKGYVVYEYIDGDFIVDYIKKSGKNKIKRIIKNIFSQLFILDNLKIDKEEMHRPLKHIIIRKDKPYLIDFERAHYTQRPKNITQFCQFIMGKNLTGTMQNKKINIDRDGIIKSAKIYKSNINKNNDNKKNFQSIIKNFSM